MKIYLKTDILEHQHPQAFKSHKRTDAGKFDICQDCPLKVALRESRRRS